MRKVALLVFVFLTNKSFCQILYLAPGLTGQYAYFTTAKLKEPDFTVSPKFNGSWFMDLLLKSQNSTIKLSLKESVLGGSFSLKTDFGNDTSLGIHRTGRAVGIDQLVLSIQLQKFIKIKKIKPCNFQFFYGLGVGVGFNRSKNYYDSSLSANIVKWDNRYNYVTYTSSFMRKGTGIFICPSIGMEWKNKKGKTYLISELYADLGLIKMFRINIDYEYGTYTNPPMRKYVNNQELNSTGSTVGLKIAVPVKLINFSNN